jgi:hypothetical protein
MDTGLPLAIRDKTNMDANLPEPHPLDYDWRFTKETVCLLADRVQHHDSILIVGVPSVASYLEGSGASILLIDRQPFQTVKNHSVVDLSAAPASPLLFDAALVDPPWYPMVHCHWIAWAAGQLRPRSELLASLWPENTRPGAAQERQELLQWLNSWAQVELEISALRYTTPLFELESARAYSVPVPAVDWRTGDLLVVRPFRHPSLPRQPPPADRWVRFVFNDYQLALRLRPDDSRRAQILPVPGACDWTWPSVSRRAPGRSLIDLWSSRNEVAQVAGSLEVLEHLRAIARTGGASLRNPQSNVLDILSQWALPVGPYWRTYEWTHHA